MTAPGTTVAGRYRVQRRLGAGGMGSVWLARDTSLGRDVAVKSVLSALGDRGDEGHGAQRAMREARLIARINHPHAVAIYDVVNHEGRPWLVMEYVPSRNLAEVVHERGRLEPRRAAEIGSQVAAALVDAHRAGIVHRDVKPANVLIAEHGSAKITDFGIARGHDDVTLTATGALWGTPAYFAPEVAQGSSPTQQADVWSLGATLYFAVEGTPPYGSDASALVLLGRIAHRPVPPPRRSGPLTPVLSRLLERDPDRRPTMSEAADLLRTRGPGDGEDRAAAPPVPPAAGRRDDGEPGGAAAPDEQPTVPTRTRPGRRGVVLPVLAVVAVAAVGALAWSLLAVGGDGAGRSASTAEPTRSGASAPGERPTARQPERSTAGTPDAQQRGSARNREEGGRFTAAAMERAVTDYYALMPAQTRRGFRLLGPGLRSQGFGTYESFWDGIESVRVSDVRADPASRSATATVVFVTEDGRTSTERHEFGLVRDPSGDGLLINTDVLG